MNSSSRNGARVRLLAVHTTEGIMRARDLLAWTSWAGSSHASNDETGVLLTPADGFVPYDRASWTLRSGNPISENIEQCGWARWTRAEWLSRPKLLDTTARWLADRSKARGIPLVKLSPGDVALGKAGVIGHVDWTLGTGDGTHTDPGKGYPWDVVIDKARAYAGGQTPITPEPLPEDDMPFVIKNEKGDLFFCGPGFAEHVATAKDDTELRRTEKLTVYDLTDDLAGRVVTAVRAVARSTEAVMRDLADEEPSSG